MRRRLALSFLMALALSAAVTSAHEGHEHKIMGTVTVAAADQVTLETKDGKKVTVSVTSATRVVRDKQPVKSADIKPGTRVVVTAVTNKGKTTAKSIQVGPDPVTTAK